MENSVLIALCQYFLLKSKSVNGISEELSHMSQCIIQEHLPIIHIWNYPHIFDVEYASIRHNKICSEIQLHYPNVISNIICEYISDISFTKINTPFVVRNTPLWGNIFNDTSISLKNTTITEAIFRNVSITVCVNTVLVKCLFINCSILIIDNTVAKKCKFKSVTFGNNIKCKYESCSFNRVSFRCVIMNNVKFIGCIAKKIAIANSIIDNLIITRSRVENIRIIDSSIDYSTVSFSYLNLVLIGGHSQLNDICVKRCNIKKIGICDTNIKFCEVYNSKLFNVALLNTEFELCMFTYSISDIFTHMCKYTKCHLSKHQHRSVSLVINSTRDSVVSSTQYDICDGIQKCI
jgi:uncharacterized protein YjbI with pentapeptide repeats